MKKSLKFRFFLIALFLAFLPYVYLSFFANPCADDFVFAHLFQNSNYFKLVTGNYFNWSGRYISNFLIYLNPISFDRFFGYKLFPIFTIALFVISVYAFIHQLLNKLKHQLRIALIISLLFLHNLPILSEGIYWFTGAVIYQFGIIAALFYGAYLIKVMKGKRNILSLFLLSFLLFLSCGFNEVLTLLLLLSLTILLVIAYKNQQHYKNIVLSQFILALIFSSLLFLAPGNAIRGASYQNEHLLIHAFILSIAQSVRFFLTWAASVPLLVVSFIYLSNIKHIGNKLPLIRNSFFLNRWFSFGLLFVIPFCSVFPPIWATGILGQHRTLNVGYFFFLMTWFTNLTIWGNYFQEKVNIKLYSKWKNILFATTLCGLVFTGNGVNALIDIFSGAANNYDTALTERFQLLNEVRIADDTIIELPPIISKPKCIFVSDISASPNYWTNQAYNLYFRLEKREIITIKRINEE